VNVFVANEQNLAVDETRAGDLARHVLESEEVEDEAELSVLLVTPDHMRRLNARFAGNDFATDVLAFPLMEEEEDGELLLGDVVICPDVAAQNAEKLGHPLTREIDNLVVHGTLHLLGYDHQSEDDRVRMNDRTRLLLDSFSSVG
jgi:probable rRNA maturation factor